MKYPDHIIKRAMSHEVERDRGVYYFTPSSDKEAYKHKVSLINGRPVCGCKWAQVNLNKDKARLCSHALRVLFIEDRKGFIKEISKQEEE